MWAVPLTSSAQSAPESRPLRAHFPQALRSIERLEEEDTHEPAEELAPGSWPPDGSRWDEEPSPLEELADFMGQVWRFLLRLLLCT